MAKGTNGTGRNRSGTTVGTASVTGGGGAAAARLHSCCNQVCCASCVACAASKPPRRIGARPASRDPLAWFCTIATPTAPAPPALHAHTPTTAAAKRRRPILKVGQGREFALFERVFGYNLDLKKVSEVHLEVLGRVANQPDKPRSEFYHENVIKRGVLL